MSRASERRSARDYKLGMMSVQSPASTVKMLGRRAKLRESYERRKRAQARKRN